MIIQIILSYLIFSLLIQVVVSPLIVLLLLTPVRKHRLQSQWKVFVFLLFILLVGPGCLTLGDFVHPGEWIHRTASNDAFLNPHIEPTIPLVENSSGGTGREKNHDFILIILPFALLMYFSGFCFFLVNLIRQRLILAELKKGALIKKYRGIRLFISSSVEIPFCFGFFRSSIFLSPEIWDDPEKRIAVLSHEIAHITNGHPKVLYLSRFMKYISWFNPLVAMLNKRGEELAEYISDSHGIEMLPLKQYLKVLISAAEENLKKNSCTSEGIPLIRSGGLKKRVEILLENELEEPMKRKKMFFLAYFLPVTGILIFTISCQNEIMGMKDNLVNETIEIISSDESTLVEEAGIKPSDIPKEYLPDLFPVEGTDYRISQDYGIHIHPITKEEYFHKAIDISCEVGTPVLASASGKIIETGFEEETRGFYLVIENKYGVVLIYTHLEKILIEEGFVQKGQKIALSGNSGKTTGPHLHYEVHINGEPADPESFF